MNFTAPKRTSNDPNGHRVLKGGSFFCNDSYNCGYRFSVRAVNSFRSSSRHNRFRCLMDTSEYSKNLN